MEGWEIVIGVRGSTVSETRKVGGAFSNFVETKLSTFPFSTSSSETRRNSSLFTTLYSITILRKAIHLNIWSTQSPIMSIRCWIFRFFISHCTIQRFVCTSEPCLDTLDIIYFSKKIGYFFLPRLDTYARSNEFYLDGSRKGESLPRTLKSTGNDFPANFQRVCRLIFSHRAIRIISVDTPFFSFFLPSLPFFSLLFFSRAAILS